jgi:hypothetical protein
MKDDYLLLFIIGILICFFAITMSVMTKIADARPIFESTAIAP